MESIVQEGHSIEKAVELALERLGSGSNEVEVEILDHPKKSFWGLFSRPARVKVTVLDEQKALKKVVSELFGFMGIDVDVNVYSQNGALRISVEPKQDVGLAIGKGGRTLEAIEHLVQKIAKSKFNCQKRLHLDIAGYKKRQGKTKF